MSTLIEAIKKLDTWVEDLSSLHVQTFTGNVTFTFDNSPESNKSKSNKYDNIEKQIQEAKNKGNITLIAESLYKFDGDSYNFLITGTDTPSAALELHKSAVESGIKTRQGLMEMAKSAIGL